MSKTFQPDPKLDGHNPFNPDRSGLKVTVVGPSSCATAKDMEETGRLIKMPKLCTAADAANISELREGNVGVIIHRHSRAYGHEPVAVEVAGTVYQLSVVKKEQSNFAQYVTTWCNAKGVEAPQELAIAD